ncbi:MAG: hypothetical protein KAR38_02205, partial [Calditrichia bacterium]|nr:hypothetical protein [Calditrichia bacterium]
KKIKNEINFSLKVDQRQNRNYSRSTTGNFKNKYVEMDVSNTMNINPGLTYRLSRNVNGEVYSVYRKQKSKRMEHSHFEMGIRVNIEIR